MLKAVVFILAICLNFSCKVTVLKFYFLFYWLLQQNTKMWAINYNTILSHMFPMRKVKQKKTISWNIPLKMEDTEFSMTYSGIKAFNNLPTYVKNLLQTKKQFKQALKEYLYPNTFEMNFLNIVKESW